jgi:hypothetical protein
VILGVPVTEIKIIASSRDREAGKINISTDKGGGMHGAEKSPNTNFDPKLKSAIEIGMSSLDDTKRAATILNHEMSHAKDYELTQKWVKQYEKDTGQTFQPGKFGDQNFTVWINKQAPKMISRADAELVSDVSANANGSSEAKAYIGSFIAALKAGSPEAAANELRNYAAGMTSKPQKINRPTGAHVELEMKRLLETEYKKMPKEMKEAFDKTFAELKQKYPDAWISKFNHATALK